MIYNWNIVENGVKNHNHNPLFVPIIISEWIYIRQLFTLSTSLCFNIMFIYFIQSCWFYDVYVDFPVVSVHSTNHCDRILDNSSSVSLYQLSPFIFQLDLKSYVKIDLHSGLSIFFKCTSTSLFTGDTFLKFEQFS